MFISYTLPSRFFVENVFFFLVLEAEDDRERWCPYQFGQYFWKRENRGE